MDKKDDIKAIIKFILCCNKLNILISEMGLLTLHNHCVQCTMEYFYPLLESKSRLTILEFPGSLCNVIKFSCLVSGHLVVELGFTTYFLGHPVVELGFTPYFQGHPVVEVAFTPYFLVHPAEELAFTTYYLLGHPVVELAFTTHYLLGHPVVELAYTKP